MQFAYYMSTLRHKSDHPFLAHPAFWRAIYTQPLYVQLLGISTYTRLIHIISIDLYSILNEDSSAITYMMCEVI